MVMNVKGILVKYGPQHLAKGVERAFQELDNIIVGAPIQPSLAGNIAMSVLGAVGAFMAPKPFDEVLAIWGGHHSTTLWDYLEAALAPVPAARARLAYGQGGGGVPATVPGVGYTFLPTTGRAVPTRPGLSTQVRYAPQQRVVTAPKFIPGVLRPKYQHGA